jgi:UDP-N-acetylglucosamine enolpyruvyl transferase
MRDSLGAFTDAYIVAALWSSTDDHEAPLDQDYDRENIHPDTLSTMRAHCRAFFSTMRCISCAMAGLLGRMDQAKLKWPGMLSG